MRVAGYIRVSTEEQAEKGNSIQEQIERQEGYCIARGWNKPIFFIDDGYSAKDTNRPKLKSILNSVEQRQFDIILTTKLDRLSRNLLDLLQLVKIFDNYECSFVSASESFDTSTAAGRMVLQLLGVFAEFERERNSERVKDNMDSIAKNTDRALTRPCFGYDIIDGKYIPNEKEADILDFMFELGELGHGHRMIAKLSNDRGYTTKSGHPWDQTNVKRAMRNPTISGTRIYNMRKSKDGKTVIRPKEEWDVKENNHPAVISPERQMRVLDLMATRSRAKKHADSETYLLTGIVKCGHCGRNMKGQTSRVKRKNKDYTYYRYICASYVAGYGCKYHAVHREDLENLILDEIKNIALSSNKKLNLNISKSTNINDELKELKNQLSRIDGRMQKQIEAYEKDLISDYDLKQARERIQADRMRIEGQILDLQNKTTGDPAIVKSNIEQVFDNITGIDRLAAKNSFRQIIDEVTVTEGELVSIVWKPFVLPQ
ncbi:recombinase family protein [Paenibacillus sp. GbtcB18]|uniref:recombinase family protein n=1 Tax=Paenibacillus sp. GbtcB18 TaxID=2824763 RepID=UPI001C30E5C1|nr:recombinase family protein [Paenibacillus sp. GbtcB18]